MRSIIVLQDQSLIDISIEAYGNIGGLHLIAKENGLSITSELSPGQQIKIPAFEGQSNDIANYFFERRIKPISNVIEIIEAPDDNCNYCKLFE